MPKTKDGLATDLWERGGGYDRNVTRQETRIKVTNYIHHNPVKKGLVEESWQFRWSSANWYLNGEEGDIECAHSYEIELD